jgi:urea transporter
MENIKNSVTQHYKVLTLSYSEIFFVKNKVMGLLILGVTFINPYCALAGLLSVLAAYIFALTIGMGKDFLSSGFYTYNPLLSGLAVGYLFKITPQTIVFTIIVGVLTFLLTVFLLNVMSYYLYLPPLSLPFALISSLAYLASSQYSSLTVKGLYVHPFFEFPLDLPLWLTGFLKSLGTIVFTPSIAGGIIIAVILLLYSRILLFLAFAGYITGSVITGLMSGSFTSSFNDISHFNYILIAMALGGVFLVPHIKNFILALVAVVTSTLLVQAIKVFWSNFGIPAFTIPFNVITIAFLYVLGIVRYPLLSGIVKDTPEETLDYYLVNQHRFHPLGYGLTLPFSGTWTVWQGFDGQWTHKGNLKHAYDFIITDENNKSYKGDGNLLTDYYGYKKPVLSPLRGRVRKVAKDYTDNTIGNVDRSSPFGNTVIIESDKNFFVAISHFSQDSIAVNEGQWIEEGTLLGLCGNSGYSPQPHIHIQIQLNDTIGGATVPFVFTGFTQDKNFFHRGLPHENTKISNTIATPVIQKALTFILDDTLSFHVYRKDKIISTLNLQVLSSADGTFYLSGNKSKIYIGQENGTFYSYSFDGNDPSMKKLMTALMMIPLSSKNNISWSSRIPFTITSHGLLKHIMLFIGVFIPPILYVNSSMKFTNELEAEGCIYGKRSTINIGITFNAIDGIQKIESGDLLFRRINNE